MILSIGLVCIYSLIMLLLAVIFLVNWIRFRKRIMIYLKHGVTVGLILLGLNVLAVVVTPSAWGIMAIISLLGNLIIATRVAGFTMLGMYYCALIGNPSFLLHSQELKAQDLGASSTPLIYESAGSMPGSSPIEAPSALDEPPGSPVLEPDALKPLEYEFNWKKYALSIYAIVMVAVLYTVCLFRITSPQTSQIIQQAFRVTAAERTTEITFQTILFLLAVAFGEELLFRLGIQNFIAKQFNWQQERYWIAVVLTAILWTLGHAGTLDPEWVKLAQVFPMGLMLGWLAQNHGIESSILAHGLFNVIAAFLSPFLMK